MRSLRHSSFERQISVLTEFPVFAYSFRSFELSNFNLSGTNYESCTPWVLKSWKWSVFQSLFFPRLSIHTSLIRLRFPPDSFVSTQQNPFSYKVASQFAYNFFHLRCLSSFFFCHLIFKTYFRFIFLFAILHPIHHHSDERHCMCVHMSVFYSGSVFLPLIRTELGWVDWLNRLKRFFNSFGVPIFHSSSVEAKSFSLRESLFSIINA